MSCKSALYMANTVTQTVAINSPINFGSVVRRFGQNVNGSGTTVELIGAGYYDVDVNLNIEGTSAGDLIIALYKDGTPIPGASATITVASGDNYQITIPCIVRNKCCCGSTITAVVTAIGANISSASITVEKV